MRRWSGCGYVVLVFALVAIVLARGAAHAASFVVDSFLDDPDADPADGVCATALAECTLRAAIEQANAIAGEAHTITLPAGGNGIKTPLPTVVQDVTIS